MTVPRVDLSTAQTYGITHHLPCSRPVLWAWRKVFCKRGWHIFDEVVCATDEDDLDFDRYLVCDACDLVVGVAYMEEW